MVRFRHSAALAVAALIAFFGALPLSTSRVWLLPILLVPLGIAVWAWRAGVDADADGLRIRALLGNRRVAWRDIAEFHAAAGRVTAVLASGHAIPLPAVRPDDLPALIKASGQQAAETEAHGEQAAGAEPPTGGTGANGEQATGTRTSGEQAAGAKPPTAPTTASGEQAAEVEPPTGGRDS